MPSLSQPGMWGGWAQEVDATGTGNTSWSSFPMSLPFLMQGQYWGPEIGQADTFRHRLDIEGKGRQRCRVPKVFPTQFLTARHP